MIKLRAKKKYFYEGDIIRHLLWGQGEINIKFLNLGQPLMYRLYTYTTLFQFFPHVLSAKKTFANEYLSCEFTSIKNYTMPNIYIGISIWNYFKKYKFDIFKPF